MNVISQDGALATLIFIPDEVRPLRGFHLPALLREAGARYGAAKSPSTEDARSPAGARFENGLYISNDREVPIGFFSLHNDAIVVATTDTSDSDLVINDIFNWMKDRFGFREPSTAPMRVYQSDLIVRFDNDPAEPFTALTNFIDFLNASMIPENARSKKPIQFNAIAFGGDPTAPGLTPEFTVARRVGVPWHLGLYFSKAHMTTPNHIRALGLLDEFLGMRKRYR